MAEEFLEPIYQKALLIYDFEKSVSFLQRRNFPAAKKTYNSTINKVEHLLIELEAVDKSLADRLFSCAQNIAKHWSDPAVASGLISRSLIPLMYEYMSLFTGIDVSEENYRIFSADSGFLTITDTDTGLTYHDTHSPLGDASVLSDSIYKPSNREFHMLGCDLGYLPYMIYKHSEGACKIVIYESDRKIIDYANRFGILSWIPDGICDFVYQADPLVLAKMFLSFLNKNEKAIKNGSFGIHINHWMDIRYRKLGIDQIEKQSGIFMFEREKYNLCVTNMMKNYSQRHIYFDTLKKQLYKDEWIVVAAGPSLDECIPFLQKSQEEKSIVAVNTVLVRLPKEGIIPDLIVAADPRSQLADHIKGFEDATRGIPLIADETTCWEFINCYQGDVCLVPTPNGDGLPLSNPEHSDIWQISGTVTTLGIESALRLGANKIYLVGLDLAFPGGVSYASGVSQKREEEKKGNCTVQSVDGKMIASNHTFDMFRQIIEAQISQHPDVDFINMSEHGALIKGARKP